MTSILHGVPLRAALDDIVATHGRWRVLVALLLRDRRQGPPVPPLGLNDHLRRDIGLEALPYWADPLL